MASFDALNADTVDEFAAALAGAHSMEEWERWRVILDNTVVHQLDERYHRKYRRSEVNSLPTSPAAAKQKASPPGRSTKETAESDEEIWKGVGVKLENQRRKKWDNFKNEYYTQRAWTFCPCEEAEIKEPPTTETIRHPTEWERKAKRYHEEKGGKCVVATDRRTHLAVA